ncbi:hypothetical protein L228DRAFT_260317 [Xylona heveae TC161]|uniref:Myb-like domain-containing protein n=1 Tax=Xylona heveae (strain CBS 132557 / TC161) TaxID=1328760 RepID=A0A165HGY3_XYLHT|nr:hypothetical protein L228DRAFT_260317 [Xylona heveae TC161]KZF23499.1 hypothetical protein L228DRAFT_260317 [Xylona heveae TC161]
MSASMDLAQDKKSLPREEEDADMNDVDVDGFIDTYAEDSSSSYAPSIASASPSKRKRVQEQPVPPPNEERPSKRKPHAGAEDAGEHDPADVFPLDQRLKRRKLSYNDKYRELLNTVIEDATSYSLLDHDQPRSDLPAGQIGATSWTSEEKESFFNALARLGRDNIRGIVTAIKTKSEVEVRAYLQLLHAGFLEIHTYSNQRKWLAMTDFPAAYEIGEECCSHLDDLSASVSKYQERAEARLEKQRWPSVPLLTQDVAQWLDTRWAEGDEGRQEVHSILPAATLFRPSTWLKLSKEIFMNPAAPREEDNWRNLTPGNDTNSETPSIQTTAFADFYTLAVSLTQRLVQTVIFQAMSRLRARGRGKANRQPMVKRSDVKSALKVLGMKPDSKRFWATAARRNNILVYDHDRSPSAKYMTYAEVEAQLGEEVEDAEECHYSKAEKDNFDGEAADAESESDEPDEADISDISGAGAEIETKHHTPTTNPKSLPLPSTFIFSDAEEEDTDAPLPYSRRRQREIARLRLEQQQDEYAEAFDRKAGLLEEERLWEVIGCRPSTVIKSEEMELPDPPMRNMKNPEDLLDWRDRVEYVSPWEVFSKPVPSEAFRARSKTLGVSRSASARATSSVGRGRRPSSGTRKGFATVTWEEDQDQDTDTDMDLGVEAHRDTSQDADEDAGANSHEGGEEEDDDKDEDEEGESEGQEEDEDTEHQGQNQV